MDKIGENLIENSMKKKIVKKKLNPIAKDLRTPKYKIRTVKNKKIYSRKNKNIN